MALAFLLCRLQRKAIKAAKSKATPTEAAIATMAALEMWLPLPLVESELEVLLPLDAESVEEAGTRVATAVVMTEPLASVLVTEVNEVIEDDAAEVVVADVVAETVDTAEVVAEVSVVAAVVLVASAVVEVAAAAVVEVASVVRLVEVVLVSSAAAVVEVARVVVVASCVVVASVVVVALVLVAAVDVVSSAAVDDVVVVAAVVLLAVVVPLLLLSASKAERVSLTELTSRGAYSWFSSSKPSRARALASSESSRGSYQSPATGRSSSLLPNLSGPEEITASSLRCC